MYLSMCRLVEDGENVIISGPCSVLGTEYVLPPVPRSAVQRYLEGAYAQEAFPMLSAAEREFIISGASPEGWNRIFHEEE